MTIETEEFYNLCQIYRHTPITDQLAVTVAYQELIKHINDKMRPEFDNSYTLWKPMRDRDDGRVY
jgi:hypothetical protein